MDALDLNMSTYVDGFGMVIHNLHAISRCTGKPCVIHNPMPGPWSSWPTRWRDDRDVMERVCPHGVGHPAVEDVLAFPRRSWIHGCCGRCPCALRDAVIEGEVVGDGRALE